MSGVRFEEVAVGDLLPALEMEPFTTTQLVRYAGASGDFNRLHFDDPFARAAGFPQVVAHGMLSMAFFGRLVADWAGGPHLVRRLHSRFRAVTFPGERVTVSGQVAARDPASRTVELKLQAHKPDGTLTLEGAATVHFPQAQENRL